MNVRWHQRSLRLCFRAFDSFVTEGNVARGFARWSLSSRMQSLQKRNQGRGLRRAQILSVRRHVAASLDYLPNQLVLRQSHRDTVQSRTSLPTALTKRMTVAALLHLKDQRALSLKCGTAMQKLLRHRVAAPSVHVRTPRRVSSEVSECSQRHGNQQYRQDGNGAAAPTLFSFAR